VVCEATAAPRAKGRLGSVSLLLEQSRSGRAYLAELQSIPALGRQEEQALARQIEQGERGVLQALLKVPEARVALGKLLNAAMEGRSPMDRLLAETPGDDLAVARARKLAGALRSRPEQEDEVSLAGIRLRRPVLDQLAAKASAADPTAARDIAREQRRSSDAKRALVRRHLWLAASMACRLGSRGLDLMDRIQEGNLGLMQAADRFHVRRGFRFATYAAHWVRRAMYRAVAEQGHCVRLPAHTLEAAQKAERVQQRMVAQSGRQPTEASVAESMSVSVERLREVHRGVSDSASIDDPDCVLCAATPSPEALLGDAEQHRALHAQIATLAAREQQVLALRFGLEDEEEASRDDVAHVFSLTRERIRQIESKAIARLQHPSRAGLLCAV